MTRMRTIGLTILAALGLGVAVAGTDQGMELAASLFGPPVAQAGERDWDDDDWDDDDDWWDDRDWDDDDWDDDDWRRRVDRDWDDDDDDIDVSDCQCNNCDCWGQGGDEECWCEDCDCDDWQ